MLIDSMMNEVRAQRQIRPDNKYGVIGLLKQSLVALLMLAQHLFCFFVFCYFLLKLQRMLLRLFIQAGILQGNGRLRGKPAQ